MKRLCERISNEQDDATFIELVQKLNDMLDKNLSPEDLPGNDYR